MRSRRARRAAILAGLAASIGLIFHGNALLDECGARLRAIKHEANYPWLPSREEWATLTTRQRAPHWHRYEIEARGLFLAAVSTGNKAVISMILGTGGTGYFAWLLLAPARTRKETPWSP